MTPRRKIVTALARIGTVGPLTITALDAEPDQKYVGAAWPVLREIARDGTMRHLFTRAYDVFVVLPSSRKDVAADTAEAVIETLVDVLEGVGEWVQPAETVQIAFDNSTNLPGIRVRIATEADDH